MLLQLTTTQRPATDLGFLLHKNPARQGLHINCGAEYTQSANPCGGCTSACSECRRWKANP